MSRRRTLGAVGTALGTGLGGCLGGSDGVTPPTDGFEADAGGGEADPVVVAATSSDTLVAYDRRVGGSALSFEREAGTDQLVGGGSRWNLVSGRALDGPHEGTTLRRANDRAPMFWFAWAEFFPATAICGS